MKCRLDGTLGHTEELLRLGPRRTELFQATPSCPKAWGCQPLRFANKAVNSQVPWLIHTHTCTCGNEDTLVRALTQIIIYVIRDLCLTHSTILWSHVLWLFVHLYTESKWLYRFLDILLGKWEYWVMWSIYVSLRSTRCPSMASSQKWVVFKLLLHQNRHILTTGVRHVLLGPKWLVLPVSDGTPNSNMFLGGSDTAGLGTAPWEGHHKSKGLYIGWTL